MQHGILKQTQKHSDSTKRNYDCLFKVILIGDSGVGYALNVRVLFDTKNNRALAVRRSIVLTWVLSWRQNITTKVLKWTLVAFAQFCQVPKWRFYSTSLIPNELPTENFVWWVIWDTRASYSSTASLFGFIVTCGSLNGHNIQGGSGCYNRVIVISSGTRMLQ